MAATICGASMFVDVDATVIGLLGVSAVLAMVGFADDIRRLSIVARFVTQLAAAAGLAVLLIATGEASWWWLPVLVVGVAGFVNAFNFMDGINGISGLTAAAVGLWWAWAGDAEGHTALATLGLILAGASIGFLPWNVPKAKVFLGDGGSYGVGVFIAGLSALAVVDGLPWWWALAPLVVYCSDTGWVLVKRARAGKSLTEAHREHVYQQLVDGGWAHLPSAIICAGATALVCVAAGAAGTSPAWWALALALAVVLAYINLARIVDAARRAS